VSTTLFSAEDAGAAPTVRLRGFHPGWYGAVMGTAIVGIIAYQDPGQVAALGDLARAFGVAMVALSAVLGFLLGIPYVARWIQHPDAARQDLSNPVAGALYGTFPGGILVLAVGIGTVGPAVGAPLAVAWSVGILAALGLVLAFVVSVLFAHLLFVSHPVGPELANGAWFIPPVVNIVVPLALLPLMPHVAREDAAALLFGAYAFWGMGFVLFVLVASLLYDRLIFHPLPAAPLAPSLWIGLGPIGVGSLVLLRAAQAGAPLWGALAPLVAQLSALSAAALWGFGLWWLASAILLLAAYLRRGELPYGLGWWGFTFPLGAYTASTLALARSWHLGFLEATSVGLFVLLLAFWLVVSAGTLRALANGEVWRR
jgi:C4-dicarboxylate transporter/malic acid transport protein